MNNYAYKIGFGSALVCALTFVLFTVCFVGVVLTSPVFMWTNLVDYIAYVEANGLFFQQGARFCMLLFAPMFLLLLNAIHEVVPDEKQLFSRIALTFGIGFSVLVAMFYFVQLTAVRFAIQLGQTSGLEQVIQANPLSAFSAINMLGWTLFLGSTTLCLAPIFANGRLQKTIRYALILNTIFCFVGGVAYIMQWLVVLFITINLGMGGAIAVSMIALMFYFRRDLQMSTTLAA